MNQVFVEEINTSLHPFQIYKLFFGQKHSFFLDSGMDPNRLGRYSFIGADPFLRISSTGRRIQVWEKTQKREFDGNPFAVLKEYLQHFSVVNSTDFPFTGGAVGYLSYDIGRLLEKLPERTVDDLALPDMMMGFYDGIVVIDHAVHKTYALAAGRPGDGNERPGEIAEEKAEEKAIRLKKFVEDARMPDETKLDEPYRNTTSMLLSAFTKESYCDAVEKVRAHIREGDVYQVNMSQRFSARIHRHPLHIYESLRTINPAPFAAYLEYGDFRILSSSPERFLKVISRHVETRPIKGTMPRGRDVEEDRKNRQTLNDSEKDRAENLMIVDLMRNDLGKVCKIGSVEVPELCCIEEYPTVFHMVSTVTGELRDGCGAVDCIEAAFPGGSITGAPKVRAMEIIDELEPTRRQIYTGSIGYVGFDGNMDMNIAIRTILVKEDKAFYQVGGGVVWDSVPEKEYQESMDKGAALEDALLS